jgi:hypothetical protein
MSSLDKAYASRATIDFIVQSKPDHDIQWGFDRLPSKRPEHNRNDSLPGHAELENPESGTTLCRHAIRMPKRRY